MSILRLSRLSLAPSLVALAVVAVGGFAAPALAEAKTAAGRAYAEAMNRLGAETIGRLMGKRGDGTIVISPYGLGSALHLLGLGAVGPAEKSLYARLLPQGVEVGRQDVGLISLQQQVLSATRDRLKLTLANAVFVPPSANSSRRFVTRAREIFAAPVEPVDFKSASALRGINAWASKATDGLVPRILDELDPDARFVLTSAVYFNGAWATAFEPARTGKAPFTRADGSTRDAAMMDGTMPVGFAEIGPLQAVWLPYDGGEINMLIIAPHHSQGPGVVAEALRGRPLGVLMTEAQKKRHTIAVRVRLPHFRAESGLDLADALSSLGLAPAFMGPGDYGAINKARSGPLQAMHRAVLDVSEHGTRASTVSAIGPARSLSVAPPFSADRPFAFAIVHEPTQLMLFAGYIADPGDEPAAAPGQPPRM
ncbi:MAG: serpin family protein [Hyphomicrobiaceae bacterium]|nr:serpin family protein [Hyphomicrobiaceae bacterium]